MISFFFTPHPPQHSYILQKFKKYTSEKHFSFQVLAHWNTYTHINNRIYRGFDVKKTLLVEFNWRSFSKKKFMWVQIGMMKCQFSKNLLVLTFLKVMCLIWVITCIFTEKLEEKKIIFFTLNRRSFPKIKPLNGLRTHHYSLLYTKRVLEQHMCGDRPSSWENPG